MAEIKKEKTEAERKLENIRFLLPFVIIAVVLGIALWVMGLLLHPSAESKCASALIPGWADSCYLSLARETGNASYCDLIASSTKRDDCVSALGTGTASSPGMCEKLTSSMLKDDCYSMLARTSESPAYCGFVSSNFTQSECYSAVALSSGDAESCTQIGDVAMRYNCNNQVYSALALQRGDPTLCARMEYYDASSKQLLADNCVLAVSMNRSDTSMCDYIVNDTLWERCSSIGTAVDCDLLTDSNQRNVCYYSAAIDSGNPADCGRVPGESLRDNCYYQIAVQKMDPSICDLISSGNMKSVCRTGTGG